MRDGEQIQPGQRFTITKVVCPDYDSYAVIHYGERWAFGCGKKWFDANAPAPGKTLVMGADLHWYVEKGK